MGIQPHHIQAEGRGGEIERQRGRSTTVTSNYSNSSGRRNLPRAAPNGAPMSPDRYGGRSVDQSSGTFYREGTPPPPPTRDTRIDASSTTNILQKAGEFYDYQYDRVAPPAAIPKATICGVTARLFWLLLGAAGLLVAIGVGVGVGVGLAGHHKSSAQPGYVETVWGKFPLMATCTNINLYDSPVATPTETSHTSSLTSTTSSSTTASATNPASSHLLSCPNGNGTKYDVPDSKKTFLLICGIDYSGADEATDLGSLYTIDMEDCMTNCATFPGCTACGWGVIPGDPGSEHRCWLKGSLQKTHQSKSGWYFAILEGT